MGVGACAHVWFMFVKTTASNHILCGLCSKIELLCYAPMLQNHIIMHYEHSYYAPCSQLLMLHLRPYHVESTIKIIIRLFVSNDDNVMCPYS